MGALTADGRATITGLLVFGIDPQRYLPNASILFTRFSGVMSSAPQTDENHD
jgi:ATP-dependent DNA helicase RecG